MYDELVKRLKNCATQAAPCLTCDMTDDGSCIETLMKQAVDAIEELTGFVQEAERDRDEYRERLDKANDSIEELQKAVLRLEEASGILDELPMYQQPVGWIPVTERLPSNSTKVLVFEFGRVEQAYTTTYTADGSLCWVVINGGSYHRISDADCPIKWWMPLPEPPKEEMK